MIELFFEDGLLDFRNIKFTCQAFEIQIDFVSINLINTDNDIWVLFQANETTINGVLQTSAQMIIDTLTNA